MDMTAITYEHAKIAIVNYFQSEGEDPPPVAMAAHASTSTADLTTWHCRLGHLHADAVSLMQAKGMATGMEITKGSTLVTPCKPCLKRNKPAPKSEKTTDTSFSAASSQMYAAV